MRVMRENALEYSAMFEEIRRSISEGKWMSSGITDANDNDIAN